MINNRKAGFSISFGVDGLNVKVGGGRSECHRQEPLGDLGACPEKISKSRKSEGHSLRFGKQFCKKNNFQQGT